VAPPFQEAEFDVRYGHGVDATPRRVDLACTEGVMEKSGGLVLLRGRAGGPGPRPARAALVQGAPEAIGKLLERVKASRSTAMIMPALSSSDVVAEA